MALTFTELTGSQDPADANTYTTASVTLTSGRLYLLAICNQMAAAATPPTTVTTTGLALAFTSVTSDATNTTNAISVWRCLPGSTVTDTILITCASSTGANWELVEITGHATTGSNGSGAIIQSKVNGSNSAATSMTVTLDSAIVSGNGRYAAACANESVAAKPVISSATWTLATAVRHGSPAHEMANAWNINPATGDTSAISTPNASAKNQAIIIEVGVAAAGVTTRGPILLGVG